MRCRTEANRTRRLVLLALLAVGALFCSLLESFYPLPLPGVRLGLSNIFTLIALAAIGAWAAPALVAARLVMVLALSGNVFSFFCSLGGSALSLPLTVLLYTKFGDSLSLRAVSVASAAAFNLGQLAVVAAMTGEPAVMAYLPVLIGIGVATGLAVGIVAERVTSALM